MTTQNRPESGHPAAPATTRLARPFRIIAFDWDGTAVMSRRDDATPVWQRLGQLLDFGVETVVITGTNFQNVARQLAGTVAVPARQRLFICTNRGSEVFGFDNRGEPTLLWRRVATAEENRQLTAAAEAVRDALVRRTGIELHIIANRLNRRKIDLIPLPEWADPPKSAIRELIDAVEQRLTGAGLAGGLHEAIALSFELARAAGLGDPRITSDGKHIEIGLTDKGDAIRWLMRARAQPQRIPPTDLLIGGDEFGPIAGFPGSDYLMAVPEARGAVLVSVGVEPGGVPPGVIHLGGGPARFLALLDEQLRQQARARLAKPVPAGGSLATPAATPAAPAPLLDLTPDPAWTLVEEGFEPAREHEIESLFTVANGYLGTRGSLAEGSALSLPMTFIAGIFTSRPNTVPELVIAPNWARLEVTVEGNPLRLDPRQVGTHRRILDLRRGVLGREWRHTDPSGRITRLVFWRFVSLADRHALVESVLLTPENYSARLAVDCVVDGRVAQINSTRILTPADPADAGLCAATPFPLLVLRADDPDVVYAFAAATAWHGEADERPALVRLGDQNWIGERWEWDAEIGVTYRVDKLVSAWTSREEPAPAARAVAHLARLAEQGAEQLLDQHVHAWAARWAAADVQLDGEPATQVAARFAAYHLIAAANPDDERVSIGARALTGEAYKGHVFWDTEIYVLPFHIFTHPPAARALLSYRYHTLPGARDKARALGYRGALYPWEATDTGQEVSPRFALAPDGKIVQIRTGELQHHISAAIAYAVWQYWQATGDDHFFVNAGAEVILETARFWASRARLESDGRYHIRNVIGPDEYHEAVDDNAYTNGMARWNLVRGVTTVELLRTRWPEQFARLAERLGLAAGEPDEWQTVARGLVTGFDAKTGLFEQFAGYFALDEIDLAAYEPRTAPMDVILGRERTAGTQVIKQPDVLMLIFLLWDEFPAEVREANFRYYEPRCGHGSSLSPSIHALLAARLGDSALAARYLRQAAEIDLANNMGNAAGGVHIAAQGGFWQALVLGCGGLRARPNGPAFDPQLLPGWRGLRFSVQWRGRQVSVAAHAAPRTLDVHLADGAPLTVTVGPDTAHAATLTPGRSLRARARGGTWLPWEEVRR